MSLFRFVLTSDSGTLFTIVGGDGNPLCRNLSRDMAMKIVNHSRDRNTVVYRWAIIEGIVVVYV